MVLQIDLRELVAAQDDPGRVHHRLALRVALEDGAEGVAPNAVLAAQVEELEDRDAARVAGEARPGGLGAERLAPAALDVDGEKGLRGVVAHRLEKAVGGLRPPEVVVAPE